jgi:hypothetical protein
VTTRSRFAARGCSRDQPRVDLEGALAASIHGAVRESMDADLTLS